MKFTLHNKKKRERMRLKTYLERWNWKIFDNYETRRISTGCETVNKKIAISWLVDQRSFTQTDETRFWLACSHHRGINTNFHNYWMRLSQLYLYPYVAASRLNRNNCSNSFERWVHVFSFTVLELSANRILHDFKQFHVNSRFHENVIDLLITSTVIASFKT